MEAWFDLTEGANSASQMIRASLAGSQCVSTDSEEDNNTEVSPRLLEVKSLLWSTLKRRNETGLRVEDLRAAL